jgi:hypothetical protein
LVNLRTPSSSSALSRSSRSDMGRPARGSTRLARSFISEVPFRVAGIFSAMFSCPRDGLNLPGRLPQRRGCQVNCDGPDFRVLSQSIL